MRRVPASVAIVTVAHVDPESGEHLPMGIAVSSMTTVTLDPPTISFNIKEPSQALQAIRASQGCFRVHWLGSKADGISVIQQFTQGNSRDALRQRHHVKIPQKDSSSAATAFSAPQVDAPDCLIAAAECILTHELPVGDHVILVAQIKSVDVSDRSDLAMAYADGSYRIVGPAFRSTPKRGPLQTLEETHRELSVTYDWPTLLGDEDRYQYADRLRSYLSETFDPSDDPKNVYERLHPLTRHHTLALGIQLRSLILEAQGKKARGDQETMPAFYGQLSSPAMLELQDRMVQFVEADRRFLRISYSDLLRFLDVHEGSCSVLPSDLLEPLRARGMISPFERLGSINEISAGDKSVLAMEHYEDQMRAKVSSATGYMTVDEVIRSTHHAIVSAGTGNAKLKKHSFTRNFINMRRLKVECLENVAPCWQYDFTGHLNPEETRVILCRFIDDRIVASLDEHPELHTDAVVLDFMRKNGIHPLTTGLNFVFIRNKITHMNDTIKLPHGMHNDRVTALRSQVEEWLHHYFDDSITLDDLTSRIERFVQTSPLRATIWTNSDILAAVAVSERTTLHTPLTEGNKTSASIEESKVLDSLLAEALKKRHGSGTEEENLAIANCLKERYNIDLSQRTTADSLADDPGPSPRADTVLQSEGSAG
ncbi:hypothetical protein E8E13_008882 [Curvularia kusanoi]|uniref:Flavin reductase like domain-containing protein n=1 Tax=Curvularia kusanoi TaxID=90978 RepID=A0A9P4TIS3_CURKU|nr:hypothetical protein E8E13_008882 [Curvularia kusanoi]